MKHVVVIIALLLLFSFHTEEIKGQMIFDTLMLNELEVLGYRQDYSSPFKKTSIDSLMKSKMDYLDLGELLAAYTPVFVKSYGRGALSTVSFRGTGASHTQVQWDDFSINSPMLGQVDLSLIPNTFFNEVELYYGGGSLFKSSGALGGTVSLSNNSCFSEQPVLFIEQMVGSYSSYATSAGFSIGGKKFSSSTRFSYQTSQNDFTYYNDSVLPVREVTQQNADFSNLGFTQSFSYKPTLNNLITVTSWNQWNNRSIPPIMTNIGSQTIEQQQDVFSRNILAWNYHKNNSRLEVKTAWFYEELLYGIGTEGVSADTLVDSQNKTNTFSAKAKYEYAFAKGIVLTTGFDFDHAYVISNNYDGLENRNTLSSYAALVKDFAGRIKVNLLLRADMVDAVVVPLMPLVGINYKILKNEDLFIRGSFSRNYHMPTLNDLYWFPGGNENLIPEESLEIEGGINYLKPINKFYFGADLSVYASRIDDWIQWIPSDKGYWSPQNVNEVFARGFELSANFSGLTGPFTFKIFAEYALTKTTNESKTAQESGKAGQQLIYIPEHTANGFLYGSIKGYYLTFNLLYTGERNTVMNENGSSQGVLPAYWMSDLSLGKSLIFKNNKLDIRFKINNLLDVSYQAVRLRAMPGRNFELLIKYNLN